MTLIKDPLSPENAEKLEEAAKDISKAALVHHTATQQDELKIITEERDLLYKKTKYITIAWKEFWKRTQTYELL